MVVALVLNLVKYEVGEMFMSRSDTGASAGERRSLREMSDPDCYHAKKSKHFDSIAAKNSHLYKMLSEDEIHAVRDWILTNGGWAVVPYEEADVNKNYINRIRLAEPDKMEALQFLDHDGPAPARRAHVTLNMGGMEPPVMKEFIIGPIDNIQYGGPVEALPFSYRGISDIPYNARVIDAIEYGYLDAMIQETTASIQEALIDSFGTSYFPDGCPEEYGVCLTWSDTSPRGPDRHVTVWMLFDMDAFYANPIGLTLSYNMSGNNPSKYHFLQLVYNGQMFTDIQTFNDAYAAGTLMKVTGRPVLQTLMESKYGLEWSTLKLGSNPDGVHDSRVKKVRLNSNIVAPQVLEPGGRRFIFEDNNVEWLGWNFHIGYNSISGIKIFDARYRGERIVYEAGLSEAAAMYSGVTDLIQALTIYGDTAWGLGTCAAPIALGIDCPAHAQLLDFTYFVDAGEATTATGVACVFEHDSQTPLRRHFDSDFDGGYNFFGGINLNSLVVRVLLPVYNYDYCIDHVFHVNGAFEVRGTTSGYLQSTFWSEEMAAETSHFGSRIHDFTAGTLHDHFLNFKLDFDIAGLDNKVVKTNIVTSDTKPQDLNGAIYSAVLSPFQVAPDHLTKKIVREVIEHEAGIVLEPSSPAVVSIVSASQTNRWGSPRGYRLKFNGIVQNIIGETASQRAYSFSKYTLAATVRHEDEQAVSSVFDQSDTTGTVFDPMNPKPLVDIDGFMNGETLTGNDIVIWATVGVHHITCAEDIPVTHTLGNVIYINAIPTNYFDYDDQSDVSNSVYISHRKGPNVDRYMLKDKKEDMCHVTAAKLAKGYGK